MEITDIPIQDLRALIQTETGFVPTSNEAVITQAQALLDQPNLKGNVPLTVTDWLLARKVYTNKDLGNYTAAEVAAFSNKDISTLANYFGLATVNSSRVVRILRYAKRLVVAKPTKVVTSTVAVKDDLTKLLADVKRLGYTGDLTDLTTFAGQLLATKLRSLRNKGEAVLLTDHTSEVIVTLKQLPGVVKIANNSFGTLILANGGLVYFLVYDDTDTTLLPVNINGLTRALDIAVGITDSYYIVGTNGRVYAWGDNTYGCLGIGDNRDYLPYDEARAVGNLNNVISIVTGLNSVFCLCVDQTGYSWGKNNYGTLATGDSISRNIPCLMAQNGLQQISPGTITTSIIADNTVYIWGDFVIQPAPIRFEVPSGTGKRVLRLKAIATTIFCSYILTEDNELYSIYQGKYARMETFGRNNIKGLTSFNDMIVVLYDSKAAILAPVPMSDAINTTTIAIVNKIRPFQVVPVTSDSLAVTTATAKQ